MNDNENRAGAQPLRPLRGVRVLELAQNLAGPYCTQILADLGADVIKVESPAGDAARAWGPPFVDGVGSIFAAANRGKRSVTLDLHRAEDRVALGKLIERTDVLVEAFRPGAFARLGFDYERVRVLNPGIIYASVLAYGEEGPLGELPGYDPLMQAHGGIMSTTGAPGGTGVRVGTSVVDMGSGMWLVIAIMAALRERESTGAGTRVSVSLFDTALAWNAYHIAAFMDTGFVPVPMGSELPMIAPYGAFATADGRIMIAAANDGLFARLCGALSLEVLTGDERFRNNAARVAHRGELNRAIEAAAAAHTTDALLELLRAAGVPCAPILDVAAVAGDPQTRAADLVEGGSGPTALRLPVRWNGARTPAGSPPPVAGADTAAVLEELREHDA